MRQTREAYKVISTHSNIYVLCYFRNAYASLILNTEKIYLLLWHRHNKTSLDAGLRTTNFPYIITVLRFFNTKRAALVDFTGHPSYAHMQPFYVEDSEEGEEHEDDQMSVGDQQMVGYDMILEGALQERKFRWMNE